MRADLRYPLDDPRVVACKRAVRKAGGLTVVARKLGVTPQAVYKWELVPVDRCFELAEMAGMTIHELRPDKYGYKPQRRAG